jgi:hypothetical protein
MTGARNHPAAPLRAAQRLQAEAAAAAEQLQQAQQQARVAQWRLAEAKLQAVAGAGRAGGGKQWDALLLRSHVLAWALGAARSQVRWHSLLLML